MHARIRLALCSALAIGLCVPLAAAHTVAMTAARLADLSGQVIVGQVATLRSYWTDSPRGIETEIRFTGVEFLKGAHPEAGDDFTLVVPGGRIGDLEMRLCCTLDFQPGQRWVLFLLPEYKSYPVAGMLQGAFRLERDAAGVERVLQSGRQPIAALASDGFFAAPVRESSAPARSQLVAADRARLLSPRLRSAGPAQPEPAAGTLATGNAPAAGPEPESLSGAMSFEEFRSVLTPILAASHDYQLTRPAGQRVPVELRPTALRAAPGSTPTPQPGGAWQTALEAVPEVSPPPRAAPSTPAPAQRAAEVRP